MKAFVFFVMAFFACSQPVFSQCESEAVRFQFGHSNTPAKKFFGPGAGEWGIDSSILRPDLLHIAAAAKIALSTDAMRKRYGHLTVDTFARYFENNGKTLQIELSTLLAKSPNLRKNYRSLLQCLHYTVGEFAEGDYSFSMEKMVRGKFKRSESEELYLAIADYAYFAHGVFQIRRGGIMNYDISLGLYDRYDWDPGVSIPISVGGVTIPVSQEFVGSFHRAGLAREFDVVSKSKIVGSTQL